MRRIILSSRLALGDLVCFSAVPYELARQYPGQFSVAISSPFPELFENNPDIVGHCDYRNEWEAWTDWEFIECHYDKLPYWSVHKSNQHQIHLLACYCQDVAASLGLPTLLPQELKGHIYLSREEYSLQSIPHQRHNVQRYWIINSGHKNDASVKQWPAENYQAVVNYFQKRVQFVQVGQTGVGHWHPQLSGVINLVGQTGVRDLVRLVHSSCGVLCGITAVSHLAAAVPTPHWQKRPRPCVVVAGGREPRSWYSYPSHRILETVGALSCCTDGGCWQSRTTPLNDGQDADARFCHRVVNGAPRCMTLIRPESVIMEIERILECQGIE